VPVRERTRLVKLCRDGQVQGWLQQYGSRLLQQVKTLIDHENQAAEISGFEPVLVPGLLQTAEYARATMVEAGTVPEDEIQERVFARLSRTKLFSRDRPPKFTFYLHEFVLRLPVGGAAVMSEQLHHLLRMSVRTYLTLRVVPAALGAHPAIAGQFQLMDVFDFKSVVYIDSETSCIFLERPEEVAAYRDILRRLDGAALHGGQSREVIARLAEQYAEVGPNDRLAEEQLQSQWR
jgi:hypothetical protein